MNALRQVISAIFTLGIANGAFAQPCSPYWTGVDSPISPRPKAMVVFDDGTGPKLYASGLTYPNGTQYAGMSSVFRWDGRAWEMIYEGQWAGTIGPVDVFDAGDGAALYLQVHAGSPSQWVLLRWTGSTWVPAQAGLGGEQGWPLLWIEDGAQAGLYGAKNLGNSHALLRWNGQEWQVIGITNDFMSRLVAFDDGSGPSLHVAGWFSSIDGIPLSRIAKWTGATWEPLGLGLGAGPETPRDMIVHDFGTGPALYIADVIHAGGMPVNRIARWDGQNWYDVGGGGISSAGITTLHVLASFDDGRGPALYAGGWMNSTGLGLPLRKIARFDGTNWDDVSGGLGGQEPSSMVVYDDGRGPSLFVGGPINNAGGGAPGSILGIAQWVGCPNCYANCDNSAVAPRLNVDDFTCFINKFATGDPYVDCNQDGVRDIDDFHCFIGRFAGGCP